MKKTLNLIVQLFEQLDPSTLTYSPTKYDRLLERLKREVTKLYIEESIKELREKEKELEGFDIEEFLKGLE